MNWDGDFIPWLLESFGWQGDRARTVSTWVKEVFEPEGFGPDEAYQAAVVVLRDTGKVAWPADLRPLLLDAMRNRRREAQLAREAQERAGGGDVTVPTCRTCDGAGWVSVPWDPQPAYAVAKGFLQTHAVACRCLAGQRMTRGDRRGRVAETIDQYEARNPHWRRQAAQDRARQRTDAGPVPEKWRLPVDRITKRLQKRDQR